MLSIAELARRAAVSERTIRYYQQLGLLRSPGRVGRGAHYVEADVARLRLIRRLQRNHFPLVEINRYLRGKSDAEIAGALAQEPGIGQGQSPASPGSARAERRVFGLARATWERIELTPDVELHVRRPLTPAQHRLVEQMMRLVG